MAKSKRLTQGVRSLIINKAVDEVFSAKRKDLSAREGRIAKDVLHKALGNYRHAWLSIPARFHSNMDRGVCVYIDGRAYSFRLPKAYPIPEHATARGRYRPGQFKLPANDSVASEVLRYVKDRDEWEKEVTSFRTDLKAFLNSVNTVKQVLEHMPELERFFPEDTTPAPVPAVRMENIRAVLKGGSNE